MNSFFIFSLPRSGSAWLSVFLSYDGVFCYHEVSPWFSYADNEGCIHTDAWQYAQVLKRRHRCFVLVRDAEEIVESSIALGVAYLPPVAQFRQATEGLPVIEHARFSDPEYLSDVWTRVTGKPFDRRRATLSGFNIQNEALMRSVLCHLG